MQKSVRSAVLLALILQHSAWSAVKKEKNFLPIKSYPMGTVECAGSIVQTLENWGSKDEWRPSPPLADGSFVLSSPTKDFGKWAEVVIAPNGKKARLQLLTAESTLKVSYAAAPNCAATMSVVTRPFPNSKDNNRFYWTDARLAKLINSNRDGLIYVWSAQMPFSWEGVFEIRKLQEKNPALKVNVILAPDSNLRDARRVVKKFGWPEEYLRQSASQEFVMRGILLHAPVFIPYRAAKLRHHVPGLKTEKYVSSHLKKVGVL